MRIQHNIMALNAYRNYTNNVAAMKSNLEKLASGYKINRAGDDAAGLAISEKMRAQITGLQTAQKNAKDGISLVQTAEGALTEVHDMLNRMVELATQSANGTYSNETDRVQLQKEMDQLRAEINRIADSSNFNGIKLLDGNMDAGGDTVYTEGKFLVENSTLHPTGEYGDNTLPDVGKDLGVDTVLHAASVTGSDTNAFSVELHNLLLNKDGSIDLNIGDNVITIKNNTGKAMEAKDIVDAIVNGNKNVEVTMDGATLNPKNVTLTDSKGNSSEFKLTGSGTTLTFTQTDDVDDFVIPAEVSITDSETDDTERTLKEVTGPTESKATVTKDAAGNLEKIIFDLTGMDVDGPGTITIDLGQGLGKSVSGGVFSYDITISAEEYANKNNVSIAELVAKKLEEAINADADNTTVTAKADGKSLTLTPKEGQTLVASDYEDFGIDVAAADSEGKDSIKVTWESIKVGYQKYDDDGSNSYLTIDLSSLKVEGTGKIEVSLGSLKSYEVEITAKMLEDAEAGTKSIGQAVAEAIIQQMKEQSDYAQSGVFATAGDTAGTFSVKDDCTGADGKIVLKSSLGANITSTDFSEFMIDVTAVKGSSGNSYSRAVGDTVTVTVFQAEADSPKTTPGAVEPFEGDSDSFSSFDWSAASDAGDALKGLAGKKLVFSINSVDYTIEFKNGSLDSEGDWAKNSAQVDVSSADNAKETLESTVAALLNKLVAANNPDPAAQTGDYSVIDNVVLTGAGSGSITVSYDVTTYAKQKTVTLEEGETTKPKDVDVGGDYNTGNSLDGIDWSDTESTALTTHWGNLATKKITIAIDGGPSLEVELVATTAGGNAEKLAAGTQLALDTVSSDGSDVYGADLLDAIQKAIDKQLTAINAAAKAKGEAYTEYHVTLAGSSGAITATYTETAWTVKDEPDNNPNSTSFSSEVILAGIDLSSDEVKDSTISSVDGLEAALKSLGTVTINGSGDDEVKVDLSHILDDLDVNKDKVSDVLEAIKQAAIDAIKDWNKNNQVSKGYHYKFAGLTDEEGNMLLKGVGGGIRLNMEKVANGTNSNFSGDYNVATTDIQTKRTAEAERLASTYFTLTEDMVKEGSTITIGRDTYVFTTDKNKIGKDGYVVYNEGDSIESIAIKLSDAAGTNKTYSVGYDGDRITLTEVVGQKNFDLTTLEGIEKSLGFKSAVINPTDDSKGLKLQIGDTADSYNQLKVNIKDCHTKALGIDTISIANQDDAQEAIDAIKAAINYVSDVRGTLGATQNRLDHTINNLSVMTENIQDAESTIRDVDIAEEMMAYTKNNILIQSAQAMLAQANQVPQGVLQLLQ